MSSDLIITNASYGKQASLAKNLVINISSDLISVIQYEANASDTEILFVQHTAFNPIEYSAEKAFLGLMKQLNSTDVSEQKVSINYFSKQFTLCPTDLYGDDTKKKLLEFNVGNIDNQVVLVNDITPDIKLIFAIEESLNSTIDTVFPQHHLKHNLCSLAQLALHSEEFAKEQIIIEIHQNSMDVVVKNSNKLLLVNTYDVKSTEDVLYYVLFIIEQFELNPLLVGVVVAGNFDSTSPIVLTLKKYIKSIKLAKGHKQINWSGLTGMPQHYNYLLLNTVFCE